MSPLTLVHPPGDLVFLGNGQNPPYLSIAVGPVRANPFHHPANQLVGAVLLAT
jgi:hypothetical protein